ncbi:hypothetical protein AB0K16_22630 [Nonomuraea jabiensis]|uniref:hypothetical protein n=1 Tax=Nonomuraea jabiensis TaxID=882448 RepID=UPI00341F1746
MQIDLSGVTHDVFLEKPNALVVHKMRRVSYGRSGDLAWAEIRDWVKKANKDTGVLEDKASSGALIRMDELDDVIDALQKVRDHHNKQVKGVA